MNTLTRAVLTTLALALGSSASLAGDLNPPAGVVAPTMKTLDQVEARTPIPGGVNPGQFMITQPGSYYLTGNRVHTQGYVAASIRIMVSDVTVDLNGYSITANGSSVAQYAITDLGDDGSSAIAGVVIRNGVVCGPGFTDAGISLSYTRGARIENVTARGVSAGTGIYAGHGGLVIDSNATQCREGFGGDRATFLRCVAYGNSQIGFSLYRSNASECAANANGDYGFYLNYRSVVERSVANDNRPGGFGAGIHIVGNGCRVDSNSLAGNYAGIFLDGATDTLVTRNSVRLGNGLAYGMSGQAGTNFPNNHVAQIITDPVNQFTSTNPWANIAY